MDLESPAIGGSTCLAIAVAASYTEEYALGGSGSLWTLSRGTGIARFISLLPAAEIVREGDHGAGGADERTYTNGLVSSMNVGEHWIIIRVRATEAVGDDT